MFNRLEIGNETALVLLAYIMIAFSGTLEGQSYGNLLAEFAAFFITTLIVISNVYVLFSRSWYKISIYLKRRKLLKEH